MKACRCSKSYESLEVLVKDPKIEAVFVATDAPSHARHCMDVLNHGKHVMTAVPAVFGSLEDAEKLLETVKKTGLKYMMAETSCYREDCYAMRQIYRAGGFGRLVYSEGEYYHYCPTPIDSYKGWRIGLPPLWYPTHSTAYYVGVTGKRFTSVSCPGFTSDRRRASPAPTSTTTPSATRSPCSRPAKAASPACSCARASSGKSARRAGSSARRAGWTAWTTRASMKDLPDLRRPPLPPGVSAGGHGGSHGPWPTSSSRAILEDRQPLVDIYEALAMTVPGIIAHQSALKDGERLKVPQFDPPKA